MFFEGLDCVEVVLVVGFKPGMVSLEGVRVEVGVGCRADEGVDFVHHCVACGDRLGELGLECVRITELVEGGFEYLGAGRWCELAGASSNAAISSSSVTCLVAYGWSPADGGVQIVLIWTPPSAGRSTRTISRP